MIRRIAVLVMLAALGGCALLNKAPKVQHVVNVSAITAEKTLAALQDTEALVVCGEATALPAPKCLTKEQHVEANRKFVVAFGLAAQLGRTLRAVPAGKPLPEEVTALVMQIQQLVDAIWAVLPKDAPVVQTLQQSLGVRQ